MTLPKRKHPRLKEYGYSQEGCYFLTLCSKDKQKLFSRVGRGIPDAPFSAFSDAPEIELTAIGKHIDETINYINQNNQIVTVDSYVIMPNHVHMMVIINDTVDGASGKPRPTNAIIPKMVSSLKRYTNKVCGSDLWQDSYYDHIIRNEEDYNKHMLYIEDNPAKWLEDEYY